MFSITPYKEIQHSLGFWIPRCACRIPGTGFQSLSVELEFCIPVVIGIPDSLSCIPDSKAQDSRFHRQKFPDSEILIPLHGVINIFFHYCLFWTTCQYYCANTHIGASMLILQNEAVSFLYKAYLAAYKNTLLTCCLKYYKIGAV